MRRDDDISNFFKRHQHKLEERPSLRAWHRLEQKLDDEKSRQHRLIYRYVSTVAAVIAVMAMITAIALFNQEQATNDQLAESTTTEIPSTVEENASNEERIAVFKEEKGIKETPEEQRRKQGVETDEAKEIDTEISNPIASNEIEKIVENKEITEVSEDGNQVVEKEQVTSPQVGFEKKDKVEDDLKVNQQEKTKTPPTVNKPIATTKPSPKRKPTIKSSRQPATQSEIKTDYNISDEAVLTANEEVGTLNPYDSDTITNQRIPSKAAKKRKVISRPKYTLKQFQWLVGEWRGSRSRGYSVEKWEKSGRNTLKGVGYLVENGDTAYVENFSIKASKGKVYYLTQLEPKGKTITFELVQFDGATAIFENKKINFPNQVILEKNNYNNFSTIYQNTQQINSKQLQLLQNRNEITNQRAVRNLSRARNKK